MRKISILLAIAAGLAGCLAAFGQTQTLSSGTVTYGPNVWLGFVTVAEPAPSDPQDLKFVGTFRVDGNVLHRVILLDNTKSYFGYDLLVEPIADAAQCRVSIRPLSMPVAEIAKWKSYVNASWTVTVLPKSPEPQVVGEDDTIALDLLVSPDGRQKVVDYIRARHRKSDPPVPPDSEVPKDFSLDDVELHLTTSTLYVNGKLAGGLPRVDDAAGPLVWFYYPGKGRFTVSIKPHDGYAFRKAGTIRGDRITFQFDGDQYEVHATHPIVGSGHAWNAYVLYDPSYHPNRSDADLGSFRNVDELGASRR